MSELDLDDLTPHDRRVVEEYQSELRAKHLAKEGPREPLDEKDAEIERLWVRIAQLETMAHAARTYLTNSTPVNAVQLDKALKQMKGEKQG